MPRVALHRMKLAELTSGVGALVLGIGIGGLFPGWFGTNAVAITVVGVVLHAFGMWDKHRLQSGADPLWATTLYWVCWAMLGVLLMWIVVTG